MILFFSLVRAILTISIIVLCWFNIDLAFFILLISTMVLTYIKRKAIVMLDLNFYFKFSIFLIVFEFAYILLSLYYPLAIEHFVTVNFLILFGFYIRIYFGNEILSLLQTIVTISFAGSIYQCITGYELLKKLFLGEISSIYEVRYLTSAGMPLNLWVTILLVMLPFSVYVCVVKNQLFFRILAGINVIALHFSILSSCSRGAYISLFIFYVVIFSLLYFSKASISGVYKKIILIYVPILLLSIPIKNDILTTVQFNKTKSQQLSVSGRVTQLEASYEIFKSNPIIGVGSNCFGLIYNQHRPKSDTFRYNLVVPNTYAQLLVEKGIVGFAMYFGLVIFFLIRVIKKTVLDTDNNIKLLYAIFIASLFAFFIREISFGTILNQRICGIFFILILIVLATGSDENPKIKPYFLGLIYVFFVLQLFVLGIVILKYNENRKYEIVVKNILYRNEIQKEEILTTNNLFNNSQIEFLKAYSVLNGLVNNSLNHFEKIKINSTDSVKLVESIKYYENAIKYNPYDDIFYHNLAMIYHFLGNTSLANDQINKAIQLAPENGIYHLSKSIISKYDKKNSQNALVETIIKQPELLNSEYWKGYKSTDRSFNEIVKKSISKLESIVEYNPHHIFKARLGALYFYNNQPNEANKILKNVFLEMPNLPRVNYFLGKIHQLNNNLDSAAFYLKMSCQKDRTDALASLDLANLYFSKYDFENAKIYFLKYVINQRLLSSTHATSTGNMYKKIALANDLFPIDYLYFTKTAYDSITYKKLKYCTQKTNEKVLLAILNEYSFENIDLEKLFPYLN